MLQVTVAVDGGPRADLALSGEEPLAVLLADLSEMLALPNGSGVAGGVAASWTGRPLELTRGLSQQGVRDGAVICLSAGDQQIPTPVIRPDQAVEVAAAVREAARPWRPGRGLFAVAVILGCALLAGAGPLSRLPVWTAGLVPVAVLFGLLTPALVLALLGPDPARSRVGFLIGSGLAGAGLMVLAVPLGSRGWAGPCLLAVGAAVLGLRARHFADPSVSGPVQAWAVAVVATGWLSATISWPDARPALLAGAVGVALIALMPLPELVARRLAEIAEVIALVALPPLAVWASGVVDQVIR